MKTGTKYRLKEDRLDWPAGTIVYPLMLCDYGVKNDDTRFTGIEHVSVTQDPEGGYPFITAPVSILEEVVDAPPVPAVLKPFNNYEISPCTRTEETDRPGHFYFEVCEPHEADVWTLYGHIPGEGVMAIGDFATREGAEEAFQRITGIPFGSHEEVAARVRLMHAGPRLLGALKGLLARLGPNGYLPTAGKPATDEARAAVGEATGRAA